MYCKKCGKEIDEDSNFCRYCGANVIESSFEKNDVPMPNRFKNAVFIDSLFIKQSIEEAKAYYPNITESDISLSDIISRLIDYTNFNDYMVYYFEIQSINMKPKIDLEILGKSVTIENTPIKIELVKAGFLAVEMSEFFIKTQELSNSS